MVLVLQQEATECGLACLAMILNHYGAHASLEALRNKFDISIRGTSIAEIVRMAKILELNGTVYLLKSNQLSSLNSPAILYWQSNHYVVLSKIDPDKGYLIMDPANGVHWFNEAELVKSYSGYAITFIPSENYTPIRKNNYPIIKSILKDVPHVTSNIFLVGLLSLALQILVLLFPFYIQKLIDPSMNSSNMTELIEASILVLMSLKACEAALNLMRGINIGRWERLFTEHLSLKVLNHLLHLPLSFFESRSKSTIYSLFNSIERTREMLSRGLAEGIVDGLFSVLIVFIIYYYNLKIGILVSSITLFYLIFNYFIAKKAQVYNQILLKERAIEVSFFLECLRAIVPIKVFSNEKNFINKWINLHHRYLSTANKIHLFQAILESSRIFIFGIQITIVVLLSLILIGRKELTLGVLYALLFYINILAKNISSITSKWFDVTMITNHAENVGNVLIHETELLESKTQPIATINTICLDNISFRYHKNEAWILKNINLSFKAGECMMLIGPSGYGKSTLLKIIMGLLPPTDGKIYINDKLLSSENLHSYRQRIASVMQDDDLFCGTIHENISFFANEMDYKRIYECAHLAGIASEIEAMPMGYNSYIGDMGVAVSGGQKQRLLLARALYTRPDVLFLDEAFSNLDMERERTLNKMLRRLGITQFIITHRQESFSIADKIIDIREIVTKITPHCELMAPLKN